MGKQRKEDTYQAYERISNRIQWFIATRSFSSYETRVRLYEDIQRDIATINNILVYEQLMAKLKRAGI